MDDLAVTIADSDVRAARTSWRDAQRRGLPPDRVQALYDSYDRIVRTQARQTIETFDRPRGR